MTGPDHYQEAERLLDVVATQGGLDDGSIAELLGRAMVHATLAQTAAVAMSHERMMLAYDSDAWRRAAQTPQPARK